MPLPLLPGFRRCVTAGIAATAAVLAVASPAAAVHQPVILDASDVLPCRAPLSRDGTDEIVFLGVLPRPHAARSLQIRMREGQPLNLEIFIPDLAPESGLTSAQLPRALLIAPDRRITVLEANLRIPFTNPDNGQRYLFLRSFSTTAIAGTYSVVVTGRAATRFAVAHGEEGQAGPFDGVLRGSLATTEEVARWYATAP